ncbi:MAG: preprotein translocase subunit SecA [Bacteroidales bacterium]|nr:preprotein translocase subunit SecA [Bacteroidales bacterium]
MGLVNNLIAALFGTKASRDMKELLPILDKIKSAYPQYTTLSHDELRQRVDGLKAQIRAYTADDEQRLAHLKEQMEADGVSYDDKEKFASEAEKLAKHIDARTEEVLNQVLPDAFAIMKETARRFTENSTISVTATEFDRELAVTKDFVSIEGDQAIYQNRWMAGGNQITWDMVHYDVQLIGGIVLHQGKISEMATGEGKTLVATLPVFLNALAGKGVHVVTVNDYLAKRDSEWMGPVFMFHGLSVDCIDKHQPNSDARRRAYNADITYGTNNEYGFDYLRDNMVGSPEELVQRKLHFAIVDEVDSVLIDDARTPLIISGPIPRGDIQMFDEYKPKVEKLVNAQRALVTQLLTDARKLISEGKNEEGGKLLLRAHKGMPKYKPLIKYLSEQGNKALLLKTENFYMQENNKNMHIVTDDLFFVIEEKQNSVELTDKGIDLITSSAEDPRFFILPDIGSEIAEIDRMEIDNSEKLSRKDDLIREFAIKSERVHTVHQLLKAYAMFERDVEYVVMDNKVKIVDEQTGRILEGRRYSDGLHQAIEAKERVKVEAATQTFATITLQNYFRMYHKLSGMTGTAETEAGEFWNIYKLDVVVIPTNKTVVRHDMDDIVYKTKREKYNAVIDEIVRLTKENRPVLVGTTSVDVSELLSKMLTLRGIKHNVLNAKQHQREAEIVAEAGQPKTVTIATNMAGRGTDIKLTPETREAGGLAIIGTERHESRRVDRQLRGRSGRQGDPGTSQFYVSLEDNLMRLFASDRIINVMDKLGLKDGETIQHSMVTRSIERAQKKVEENNFGIRKRLLEYDDVMNWQREAIYTRRRHAVHGEALDIDIANMFYAVCHRMVNELGRGDYEGLGLEAIKLFSIELPFTQSEYESMKSDQMTDALYRAALEAYNRKADTIAKQLFPSIKEVYTHQGHVYKTIEVPISDGQHQMLIISNIQKAFETGGRDINRSIAKAVILGVIDEHWKEHLREMDELKQNVQNATYEQKDPLLIYKLESSGLFETMVDTINREIVSILAKAYFDPALAERVHEARQQRQRTDMSGYQTSRTDNTQPNAPQQQRSNAPAVAQIRAGRNDPCPCGSGKKYKNCCMGKDLF